MDQRRLLHRQSWRSATRDSVSNFFDKQAKASKSNKQGSKGQLRSQIQNLDRPGGVMRGVNPPTMLGGWDGILFPD